MVIAYILYYTAPRTQYPLSCSRNVWRYICPGGTSAVSFKSVTSAEEELGKCYPGTGRYVGSVSNVPKLLPVVFFYQMREELVAIPYPVHTLATVIF